jgi:hypothetical protein
MKPLTGEEIQSFRDRWKAVHRLRTREPEEYRALQVEALTRTADEEGEWYPFFAAKLLNCSPEVIGNMIHAYYPSKVKFCVKRAHRYAPDIDRFGVAAGKQVKLLHPETLDLRETKKGGPR